jgi:hypothetical protein
MKIGIRVLFPLLGFVSGLYAQVVGVPAMTTASQSDLGRGYRVPTIANPRLANSDRINTLIRDHKLYLSLQDAIVLALENNLDIELERYDLRIADTDVLRAKAGAFPRGIPLAIREGPSGVGGPFHTGFSSPLDGPQRPEPGRDTYGAP